jgi:hypothetical protein
MAKRFRSSNKVESNRYDKILKENLLKAMDGLVRKVLGIEAKSIEPVNPDLQHTRERKADFVAKVTDTAGQKIILHVEFQVRNDARMLHRMLEYKAMLFRRYPKEKVVQYVIFLGEARPTMQDLYQSDDLMYRYHLVWIQDVNYKVFLASANIEEVVLAVLAGFEKAEAEQVAVAILDKIKVGSATELEFQRFTEQLRILSNIRNLRPLIDKIMEKVARFFVKERDPLFREGKIEGKLEGKLEEQYQLIRSLLDDGTYSLEKIASLLKVKLDFVKEVKADYDREKQN